LSWASSWAQHDRSSASAYSCRCTQQQTERMLHNGVLRLDRDHLAQQFGDKKRVERNGTAESAWQPGFVAVFVSGDPSSEPIRYCRLNWCATLENATEHGVVIKLPDDRNWALSAKTGP
jgi:hypothetical protein